MTRPATSAGSTCATSDSAAMIDLMGGDTFSGVSFSRDEIERLRTAYGYDFGGMSTFARSGSLLQLFRHVECDGLRVMAALAPHLERGEDPVRLVLRGLVAMGYDVMVDPEWVDGGGDE